MVRDSSTPFTSVGNFNTSIHWHLPKITAFLCLKPPWEAWVQIMWLVLTSRPWLGFTPLLHLWASALLANSAGMLPKSLEESFFHSNLTGSRLCLVGKLVKDLQAFSSWNPCPTIINKLVQSSREGQGQVSKQSRPGWLPRRGLLSPWQRSRRE